MEQQIIALTQQLADLVQTMGERQSSATRPRGPRLCSYDGVSKGLVARQWLMQVRAEIANGGMSADEAIAFAGAYLQGMASTWFHFENEEHPFEDFDPPDDGGGADSCFSHRFSAAFVAPGCTTSAFFGFVQSEDARTEEYLFEKASMAQAAGIPFDEAFDHIVQGLHEVLAPVKLAISHHPSANVVSLVADVNRAARMIGLDVNRTPRQLLPISRRSAQYFGQAASREHQEAGGNHWNPGPRRAVVHVPSRSGGMLGSGEFRGMQSGREPTRSDNPSAGAVHRPLQSRGQSPMFPRATGRRTVGAPSYEPGRPRLSAPQCWSCGGDHYLRDCPRRARNSVPNQDPHNEQCSVSENVTRTPS